MYASSLLYFLDNPTVILDRKGSFYLLTTKEYGGIFI